MSPPNGHISPFNGRVERITAAAQAQFANRSIGDCENRINELDGLLEEIANKATDAQGNLDYALVDDLPEGQEGPGRIIDIHSELCGVQLALERKFREEARTRAQEQGIILHNSPEATDLQADGSRYIILPEATRRPSDRIIAAMAEQHDGLEIGEELRARGVSGQPVRIDTELRSGATRDEIYAANFTTASWDPFVTREPGVTLAPTRPIQVLDIMPMATTDTDTVRLMIETTYNPNAAEAAEAAEVNEAGYVVTEHEWPVRRIAHIVPVTEEALADEGQTRAYLDLRLPFGVLQRADGQWVNGNGQAPNLGGILAEDDLQRYKIPGLTEAAGDRAIGDPSKPWNALIEARKLVRFTGRAMPTHALVSPGLWVKCLTSESASGGYYTGGPQSVIMDFAWGMRVVETDHLVDTPSTNNAANHKFGAIVGDFTGMYIHMYLRHGTRTEVGMIANQFKQFMLSIRSSIRAAYVINRPQAFCGLVNPKADGTAPTG